MYNEAKAYEEQAERNPDASIAVQVERLEKAHAELDHLISRAHESFASVCRPEEGPTPGDVNAVPVESISRAPLTKELARAVTRATGLAHKLADLLDRAET